MVYGVSAWVSCYTCIRCDFQNILACKPDFLAHLQLFASYLLAKELYGDSDCKTICGVGVRKQFSFFLCPQSLHHIPQPSFFVTLAFLCFVWMVKKKRPLLSAVVCGICLGIALLCRPYTTVWICIPLGIAAVVMRKELSLRHILIGA